MAKSKLRQTEESSADEVASDSVETDWSAVAGEISMTPVSQTGSIGAKQLQDRIASALSNPEHISDSSPESQILPWSPRRQWAFFLGASTFCWAMILALILL